LEEGNIYFQILFIAIAINSLRKYTKRFHGEHDKLQNRLSQVIEKSPRSKDEIKLRLFTFNISDVRPAVDKSIKAHSAFVKTIVSFWYFIWFTLFVHDLGILVY
jgi:hypothetical protein